MLGLCPDNWEVWCLTVTAVAGVGGVVFYQWQIDEEPDYLVGLSSNGPLDDFDLRSPTGRALTAKPKGAGNVVVGCSVNLVHCEMAMKLCGANGLYVANAVAVAGPAAVVNASIWLAKRR